MNTDTSDNEVSVFFISTYTLNVIGLIIEPWILNHRYTNGPVYL